MGFLGILKNLLLVFLVLLFIIDFVAVSWVVALSGTALNPKFYEQQLEASNAFGAGQEAIADFGAKALSEQAAGLITEEEARQSLKRVVSREWLKTQSYALIENGFAYLKSEKEGLELKVSLVEPKQKLAEVVGSLIEQKIASSAIPLPEEMSSQQMLEQLVSESGLPDEMDLGSFIGNDIQGPLEQARLAVKMFYSALLGMVLAAILLLAIMIGLNFRRLLTAAKWAGIALLLGGIITAASAQAAQTMAMGAAGQAIQANSQGLPAGIAELAVSFAGAFIQGISSTALGFGIAAIAVGVLCLILGFGLAARLIGKKQSKGSIQVPVTAK